MWLLCTFLFCHFIANYDYCVIYSGENLVLKYLTFIWAFFSPVVAMFLPTVISQHLWPISASLINSSLPYCLPTTSQSSFWQHYQRINNASNLCCYNYLCLCKNTYQISLYFHFSHTCPFLSLGFQLLEVCRIISSVLYS